MSEQRSVRGCYVTRYAGPSTRLDETGSRIRYQLEANAAGPLMALTRRELVALALHMLELAEVQHVASRGGRLEVLDALSLRSVDRDALAELMRGDS